MHSDTSATIREPNAKAPALPLSSKLLLTLEEAAQYTGIGINRFRELSHDPDFADEVVCVVGKRRLFRRMRLEEYIDSWSGCEL
jgi:hypothetical protein